MNKFECLGVIPNTYTICGEELNYCSEFCWLKSIVLDLANSDSLAFIAVGAEGLKAINPKNTYPASLQCVLCKGEIPEGHYLECPAWRAQQYRLKTKKIAKT